jgi:hypothetical protein
MQVIAHIAYFSPVNRYITLLTVMLLSYAKALGQEYGYVNTDSLILRDRPEKVYNVFAILHAPCQVTIEPYDNYYKNNRAVTGKFYEDNNGIHHHIGGWVEKRYMVDDPAKITVRGANMNLRIAESEVMLIPYIGDDKHNPNSHNTALRFQAPKYKGGEKQPEPFKKVYQTGARGGCYYVNAKGKKVYVDKKFCIDKKK